MLPPKKVYSEIEDREKAIREIEESVELYFADLAVASETYSGDLFDDETHDNFYVASREVISQGTESQLAFLRDNAPFAYKKLTQRLGLNPSR